MYGQQPRNSTNRYQSQMRNINFNQFRNNPAEEAAAAKRQQDADFWGNAANLGLSAAGTVGGGLIGGALGAAAGGVGAIPGATLGASLGGAAGSALGGMAKNAVSTSSNKDNTELELRKRREEAIMNAIAMMGS